MGRTLVSCIDLLRPVVVRRGHVWARLVVTRDRRQVGVIVGESASGRLWDSISAGRRHVGVNLLVNDGRLRESDIVILKGHCIG